MAFGLIRISQCRLINSDIRTILARSADNGEGWEVEGENQVIHKIFLCHLTFSVNLKLFFKRSASERKSLLQCFLKYESLKVSSSA